MGASSLTSRPQAAAGRSLAAKSSSGGRHATPFTPLQAAGRQRRQLAAPAEATLGFEGRATAAPMTPRPYGVAPGFVQRTPAAAPPPPPPLPLQQQAAPQRLTQQQKAAEAAAIEAMQALQAQQRGGGGRVGAAEGGGNASGLAGGPDELEMARRQKISAANKGRVPWNKGRKHPPEVIARIRAATRRAMQRPEVKERLSRANEKREPHTDEAKKKIREKLLQRADKAREEINAQAIIIVERLRASHDPEIAACGEYERAREVVAGLAWQFFKKDWDTVSTRGWQEHPEFQPRCIKKLQALVAKKRAAGQPRKKKVDRVRAAMAQLKKLSQAQAKLAAAEEAVAKLQRAKAAFVSDPARVRAFAEAEAKAGTLLAKLRKQVAKLEEALQPLQQYLDAEADDGADLAAQQRELEQRLEAEAARHEAAQHAQHVQQQPPAAAAAAQLNGAAEAAAAASSNGSAGHEAHAVNGHAAAVPPPAAAAALPVRSALPWQQ